MDAVFPGTGLILSERNRVIDRMRNDPVFAFESLLQNAPEYVAENLRNHHGIQVIAEDPDDIIRGIGSVLINENLSPRETLQRILNVPVIYDRLSETGRSAVVQAMGPMTLPGSNILLDGSFDIGSETAGLPDGWEVEGGPGGSGGSGWINVVNGLLPGILQIFGIGSNGTQQPQAPNPSDAYLLAEAERKRKENQNRIITYSIIGLLSVVALFFGIRMLKNQ